MADFQFTKFDDTELDNNAVFRGLIHLQPLTCVKYVQILMYLA